MNTPNESVSVLPQEEDINNKDTSNLPDISEVPDEDAQKEGFVDLGSDFGNLRDLFSKEKKPVPEETSEDREKEIQKVQAKIEKLKRNARVPTPIPKKQKTVVEYKPDKPTVVVAEKTYGGNLWKKFTGFFSKRDGQKKDGERREDFEA